MTQEYQEHWSKTSKLIFKILFAYFTLYALFILLDPFFEPLFRWVGILVFKIDYEYTVGGTASGDTTYKYLSSFVNAILTLLIVPIWHFLDNSRKNYNTLFYWFLVLLRIILIATMFLYAFVKIFKVQFHSASLTHLLEPLGNLYPNRLAWSFFGFSESYNVFLGSLELLGGLLLIPRRTQTLGSLIILGVMTQVLVMNFTFDIAVKLFSIHLVLMALIVFVTDNRFINVFIRNKGVESYKYFNPISNKKYHKVIFWVKSIGLIIIIGLLSYNFYTVEKLKGDKRVKPILYGIWEVSNFIKNGDTLPPLTTDDYRWRYLIVDFKDKATIKTMDEVKHKYTFITDSTSKKIIVNKNDTESNEYNFEYVNSNSDELILNGIMDLDTLEISLIKVNHREFNLYSREFNWIIERPYND
ncbi:hypothetical protein [Salegentibacter sp. Hel_I_6]|uniref:hypothetical protein n=1 Tax=Salegentibacter sp. Hel_I_6 TaxID=1250278 RepID=UPI00056BD3CF|nr:hypothetical protein [Salegentibacter sp. Hel_I_6]